MQGTILVADTCRQTAELLGKALKARGFCVDFAWDGIEASGLIRTRNYQWVFLEHDLPEISGLEVVKWAHQNAVSAKFILMTAYTNIDEAFAKALGAYGFVRKPYAIETLVQFLDEGKEAA